MILNDKRTELPNIEDVPTGPADFVYKPQSTKDKKALFILPSRLEGLVSKVVVYSQYDDEIEELKARGKRADGRWYFGLTEKGDRYGESIHIKVQLIDDTAVRFEVKHGSIPS